MPIETVQTSKALLQSLLTITRANLVAIGWQSLTVDNTAGGVSLTVPTNARYALIVVESTATGTAVRYLECGPGAATVTSSVGIPRSNLDAFDIQGYQNLLNFRVIQAQAGTHTLSIQYYK